MSRILKISAYNEVRAEAEKAKSKRSRPGVVKTDQYGIPS